jgi:hypothetical protein
MPKYLKISMILIKHILYQKMPIKPNAANGKAF